LLFDERDEKEVRC